MISEAITPDSRLAEPPHLRQARQMVAELAKRYDKDPTVGLAALDIAAECYRRIASVSPAQQARKEQSRTQKELERVSRELQHTKHLLEQAKGKIKPLDMHANSRTIKALRENLNTALATIEQLRQPMQNQPA